MAAWNAVKVRGVRQAVRGAYQTEWAKTDAAVTNPDFKCPGCGSHDISFRNWESDCGGFDDVKYRCDVCGRLWWVESADS